VSECTKYPCPPPIIINGVVLHPDHVVNLVETTRVEATKRAERIQQLEAELGRQEMMQHEAVFNAVQQCERPLMAELDNAKAFSHWVVLERGKLRAENSKLAEAARWKPFVEEMPTQDRYIEIWHSVWKCGITATYKPKMLPHYQ